MSIRAKLIMLICGIIVSSALSVASYFGVNRGSVVLETERGRLNHLRESIITLDLAVNRVDTAYLPAALAALGKAWSVTEAAFSDAETLTALRNASPVLSEAMNTILSLRKLTEADVADMMQNLGRITDEAKRIFMRSNDITLFSFYSDEYIRSSHDMSVSYGIIQTILGLSFSLHESLSASAETITVQQGTIDAEIAAIGQSSVLVAVIIILFFLSSALGFSLFLVRSIIQSIRIIEDGIRRMAAGDVVHHLSVRGHDELSRLCRNMNTFIDSLGHSLSGIKAASGESSRLQQELQNAVQNSTETSDRIGTNSRSISDTIAILDDRIMSAVTAMTGVEEHISAMNQGISRQDDMIGSSDTSLQNMIGGLDQLAASSEVDQATARRLGDVAAGSKLVFREAFDRVDGISGSIGDIREMIAIIQGISAQTNLLAMNAAIEAAHAGEAGNGFSVVASEIRKLAEIAGNSSKNISRSISGVVEKIQQAVAGRQKTEEAFRLIEEEIARVQVSASSMYKAIADIREQGVGVMGRMRDLLAVSEQNADGTTVIGESSGKLRDVILQVEKLSSEVSESISRISTGLADMNDTAKTVLALASQSGSVSQKLTKAIDWFQTD